MASTKSVVDAPAGVKTNRKLVRVIQVSRPKETTRYFDFAVHSERQEFVRLVSWALKEDVTLIVHPQYVE